MTQDCVWGRTIGLPSDPPCSVPATQRMILVYAGEDHDVQVCPAHRNKIVEESKLLGLWPMMKDPDNWDESFNTMSLFVWWWGLIAIFTASTTMMW